MSRHEQPKSQSQWIGSRTRSFVDSCVPAFVKLWVPSQYVPNSRSFCFAYLPIRICARILKLLPRPTACLIVFSRWAWWWRVFIYNCKLRIYVWRSIFYGNVNDVDPYPAELYCNLRCGSMCASASLAYGAYGTYGAVTYTYGYATRVDNLDVVSLIRLLDTELTENRIMGGPLQIDVQIAIVCSGSHAFLSNSISGPFATASASSNTNSFPSTVTFISQFEHHWGAQREQCRSPKWYGHRFKASSWTRPALLKKVRASLTVYFSNIIFYILFFTCGEYHLKSLYGYFPYS